MAREQARLISSDELLTKMKTRRASYRTLGRWAGCSQAMIGLLATGKLSTCTPQLAERIEHALNVEPGSLFLPSSSSVKFDDSSIDGEVATCP